MDLRYNSALINVSTAMGRDTKSYVQEEKRKTKGKGKTQKGREGESQELKFGL